MSPLSLTYISGHAILILSVILADMNYNTEEGRDSAWLFEKMSCIN